MLTTKDENSSARLCTEILPLRYTQGQNDISLKVRDVLQKSQMMLMHTLSILFSRDFVTFKE